MPAFFNDLGSEVLLNCGLRAERGTVRTRRLDDLADGPRRMADGQDRHPFTYREGGRHAAAAAVSPPALRSAKHHPESARPYAFGAASIRPSSEVAIWLNGSARPTPVAFARASLRVQTR